MNPCPCGQLADPGGNCKCTAERVAGYCSRISGPLLDRIDLQVEVPRVATDEIASSEAGESSATVAARVTAARARQIECQGQANAHLEGSTVLRRVRADAEALKLLACAMNQFALSARAYHRVLKVARTIADLADSKEVIGRHVSESVTLRQLDRRVAGVSISA